MTMLSEQEKKSLLTCGADFEMFFQVTTMNCVSIEKMGNNRYSKQNTVSLNLRLNLQCLR